MSPDTARSEKKTSAKKAGPDSAKKWSNDAFFAGPLDNYVHIYIYMCVCVCLMDCSETCGGPNSEIPAGSTKKLKS